ncbi:hypothetical protein [Massilia sp. METH4]|uniref:hypothetical protein n=1 Tax=Massilia sp. METH4 TaxID=3123041 RepID=UPI0030CC63D8
MFKPPEIKYAHVDELMLDPTNPRLGRRVASEKTKQDVVLDLMKDWTLEELVTSFAESGFWPQEAVIVVKEELYGKSSLVVVEGNRRLAAVKFMLRVLQGESAPSKVRSALSGEEIPDEFFQNIPYIEVGSRKDVAAYLGFRHVTGIKEWNPAEKAQYIAKLIDEDGMSYEDVRKKIGSKAPTVRQHYISYRLLLQMDNAEEIDVNLVEEKFSVLYLTLRTSGAKKYLHINAMAEPGEAEYPVPDEHLDNLANFAKWLFGTNKHPPLFTDSRNVDDFGKILESDEAVAYLERTENPRFEMAYRKSGLGEDNLIAYVNQADDNVQLSLQEAHLHRNSKLLQKAVRRLKEDVLQLVSIFPEIKRELKADLEE